MSDMTHVRLALLFGFTLLLITVWQAPHLLQP